MNIPLTPLLLAAELAFLLQLVLRAPGERKQLTAFWLWVVAYALLATYLGYRGVYLHELLIACYFALWGQFITVLAFAGPVVVIRPLRDGLRNAIDATPRDAFILFHMLRLAALGTLVGAAKRDFPLYFEILVGIPDLAFACSTFWALTAARKGQLSDRAYLRWNLIGALVIVPAAPILLQLGMPGPWQLFAGQPDARAVFAFPMAIAPIVGVPIFVLVNVMSAWRTYERMTPTQRLTHSASQTAPRSA